MMMMMMMTINSKALVEEGIFEEEVGGKGGMGNYSSIP